MLTEITDKQLESLTWEEKEHVCRMALGVLARSGFTYEAFSAFFQLIHDKHILKHWEGPLKRGFDSYATKGEIAQVVEAFRGSAKTTTYNITLSAFLVGCFPTESGLVVQVGDETASDFTGQTADIIANNPGWKFAFPYIIPDEALGWGASGYEIQMTSNKDRTPLGRDRWRALNSQRKDPSFMGVGYKSRALIGRRPYWLIVDDIHDENNTSSEREMLKVKTILRGTIFPAANRAKIAIFIGTPWNEGDALHVCIASGEFDHIKIPVFDKEGKLVWPEITEMIRKQRNLAGQIEFARMYELDLSKTRGLVLKKEWLHTWPNKEIKDDWPVVIGVDFTSTADPRKEKGDYFALCVGRIIPGGRGIVVEDGVRARFSQAEAEQECVAWAMKYPSLLIFGVEAIITGQNFYNDLLNNSTLRSYGIAPTPVRFNKSKGYRFEVEMAKLFQTARVYLSDAENEFLGAFRDEWLNWQGDALESMYYNDALDSCYSMLKASEGFVAPSVRMPGQISNPYWKDRQQENPFLSLGRR